MAKKNLKEKINDAVFWTVVFCVLYLIIGYLLESLWLTKPLKTDEFYSLLKDGLSITAAFLAPVAAFVLFSDWREEHAVKSLFSLIDSIKSKASEIETSLLDYERNIRSRRIEVESNVEVLSDNEKLTKLILQLSILYIELDDSDRKISEFKDALDDFAYKARLTRNKLYGMELSSIIVKKYQSLNNKKSADEQINPIPEKDLYDNKYREFSSLMPQVSNHLNQLIFLSNEIKKIL